MKRKALYLIPVLLGTVFCFYYICLAGKNVAYSDYIRLINAYLPDVLNPAKFFVPDILTRVPVTYLGRIINVKLFGLNTYFDMTLGVLSLALGGLSLARYTESETKEFRISYAWFLLALFAYFSLNKWEMLTNGTGWVCFLSISGFYIHYLVLNHAVRTGHKSSLDRGILLVLPSVLTLLITGPYCGSYSALLLLVYLVMMVYDYRKNHRINRLYTAYFAAVLIPLLLYLWSNSMAVYVHRGAVGGSIIGTFLENPLFFLRFILKAFASAVLGSGQIEALKESGSVFGTDGAVFLLGFFVICLYLYALFLTWSYKIYEKTIFPLLLILNGGLNHLLILSARWIFLQESYGMSSRYEIQYQMGMIGIILTFAIAAGLGRAAQSDAQSGQPAQLGQPVQPVQPGLAVRPARRRPPFQTTVIALGAVIIFFGNFYTTKEELKTAPYRKAFLAMSEEVALDYENASDEDLVAYLQHDATEVRKAMKILEENNLNLFRNK